MPMMPKQWEQWSKELLERMPNGLPRISNYNEFLRITGMADSPETFVSWSQAAFTLIGPPPSRIQQ